MWTLVVSENSSGGGLPERISLKSEIKVGVASISVSMSSDTEG